MIPWFIVNLIAWLAWPFGRDVYVTATSGNWWGAERVHFFKRATTLPRPRKLARYRGGPLTEAPFYPEQFQFLDPEELRATTAIIGSIETVAL